MHADEKYYKTNIFKEYLKSNNKTEFVVTKYEGLDLFYTYFNIGDGIGVYIDLNDDEIIAFICYVKELEEPSNSIKILTLLNEFNVKHGMGKYYLSNDTNIIFDCVEECDNQSFDPEYIFKSVGNLYSSLRKDYYKINALMEDMFIARSKIEELFKITYAIDESRFKIKFISKNNDEDYKIITAAIEEGHLKAYIHTTFNDNYINNYDLGEFACEPRLGDDYVDFDNYLMENHDRIVYGGRLTESDDDDLSS